jgi:membrane dipeptidase
LTAAANVPARSRIVDLHAHFPFTQWFLGHDQAQRHKAPWFWNPFKSTIDLPRARDAGVMALFSVVFVPRVPLIYESYADTARRMLLKMEAFVQEHAQDIALARTADELEAIIASGRLGAIHAVEGGHVIEDDVDNIDMLYDLGVRLMTITHDLNNNIAAAATHPRDLRFYDGLTDFGRTVIKRMNDRKMIVDLSHASERAFWDVLKITSAPTAATHTGTQFHSPGERNLTDDQLRALSQNDGIVGVILWPWLLRPRGILAGIDAYVDNITRIIDIAGIEHVAIGTDLNGLIWTVRGIRDVLDVPKIADALGRRYTNAEVDNIMGKNALRFFRKVCG